MATYKEAQKMQNLSCNDICQMFLDNKRTLGGRDVNIGSIEKISFSGTATKRNLAVMEINDYINNSASR